MNHIIFLMILHSILEFKYNLKKNWMSKIYILHQGTIHGT